MPSDLQKQAAKSLHKLAESCGAASRPDVDDNIAPPEPKSGSEVRGGCWGQLGYAGGVRACSPPGLAGWPCRCRHAAASACTQDALQQPASWRPALRRPLLPPPQVMLGAGYVNSQKLSDLTFVVEGRPFHAHRIALLGASEIFRTMFDGHYREKDASTIPIPNIRWEVFERMMTCIYTGACLGVAGRECGSAGGQGWQAGAAHAGALTGRRRRCSAARPAARRARPPWPAPPAAPSPHPPHTLPALFPTTTPFAPRPRRQGGGAAGAGAGAAGGGGPVHAGHAQAPVRERHHRAAGARQRLRRLRPGRELQRAGAGQAVRALLPARARRDGQGRRRRRRPRAPPPPRILLQKMAPRLREAVTEAINDKANQMVS